MTLSEYERRMWSQIEAHLRGGDAPVRRRMVVPSTLRAAVVGGLVLSGAVACCAALVASFALLATLWASGRAGLAVGVLLVLAAIVVIRGRSGGPAPLGPSDEHLT